MEPLDMNDEKNRRLDRAVATALGYKVEETNAGVDTKYWMVTARGHAPLPRYSSELCQAWPLIREAERRWKCDKQRLINFVRELPRQPFNFKEDVLATAICAAFTQAAN
jgi:hypothetical protein